MHEVKFNEDGRMVNKSLLSKALKMENQGLLVDFAWKKKMLYEEVLVNQLVIKECDSIEIPVSLQKIGNLKVISTKLSVPAFGKNYLPFDVSQKWELSGSKICSTTFEDLNLSSLAFRYLRLPTKLTNVQAKLQKLILFGNGGFIQSNSDCIVDGKIGTVILQLPVEGGHLGGSLNVEYKGRTKTFENHQNSDKNFYLSTFYNCCEYFTKPVTLGYQLNLVFDLIWTNVKIGIPQELPVFLTSLKQVKEALKPWMQRMDFQEEKVRICTKIKTENNFDNNSEGKFKCHKPKPVCQEDSELPDMNVSLEGSSSESFNKESDCLSEKKLKENILFFILHEKYDMENFVFEFLRGKDRKMADLLQSCVFLDVHIAMTTVSPLKIKTESSLDSRCFEPVANLTTEENNEGIGISHLIDSDNVTKNVSIELKWRKHFIEDIASDREKNWSDKIELAKKHLDHGVMVIWPKYQAAQIYCCYGLESLLSSMEKSISLPKWQEEARQSARNNLRQLISFCYGEPQRAWTKSGLEKGELTLRVLRLCIAMRAHEEGLDLLKLLGSNFGSRGRFDTENFEGIQTKDVAQAISDFLNEVTGWVRVAELIEPLLSHDRITKQLHPILDLAKCLLKSSCVQGANMVGDAVSSFFAELDPTRASRSKKFDVEAYLEMIVDLELNPETSSRRRTASFVFFFAKVRSSLQCRLLLYFEAQFSSPLKNNQSCKKLFHALCLEISSGDCNIYAPPVKTIIVDLVSCFIRLGNPEFLQSLSLKMCRVPDKVPEGFHVKNQNLVEKIVSSPAIWELAKSSEVWRSTMASLVDHHLTLLTHKLSAFEDEDQVTRPDKIKNVADQEAVFRNNPLLSGLSTCIWLLMEIQEHYDDEDSHCLPIRVRVEWKISLILAKLCAQQMMQLLIDVLKEHSGYLNKHLLSFGTLRTCLLFFSRMKDNVTVMPRRETVLELVNWFIQAGYDALVPFILEQVCTLEKLGTWSYQQKIKLFEMLVSSTEVWMKLDSGSKLLVLKSCVDVAIVCNDISQNSSILHDCVLLLFMAEKNQPPDGPSIATHIFTQFLKKITTPQLMDLLLDFQLSEKKYPNITNFPACAEWFFIAYRIFFKQDFVSFVKSTEESAEKILKCLFWLNDFACWECFELQLCQSFPSEEANLFLQAVVNNEDLREVCLNAPLALNVFRRILDHWIQYSNPQKELPFTWRQPHAVLSDHPRVELFLRSSQECMTYANFHSFSDARLFGEGLEKNGPKHGFSVRVFPGGKGKYAYCEIVKNLCHPSFFTKVIEARQSESEKLVQLRQDLHYGLYNSSEEAVQDTLAYFQGSSELSTTTGNWSSSSNASQTAYIAPTPVNSQPVDWNAASHASASVTLTTSTGPMSTTSSKTFNEDYWSERIDNLAADFRKAEEQLPVAPSPPPDDSVAFVDACMSSENKETTKRRAIRLDCQSSSDISSQMATASMSIAPPASWCSWKIPKTKKSQGNEDLAPKADAGKVKGRTNLDGNKSGRRTSSSSKRIPCVSGANAIPVCDRRKKTVDADPQICRKCNQRGHTFLKCPNDSIGGRNVEMNPISLSSAPSVGINLATNEDWIVEKAKPYKETSRCDVSSRREVAGNIYSWKQGQKTLRSTEPKPCDNWGARGDARSPYHSFPNLPSTSDTSGITRAGLDKCDIQPIVNKNVPVPGVIDVKMRWNLKEIESSRIDDSLQPMGQHCEIELNKSNVQVPGIRKVGDMGLNVGKNPIHCRAHSVSPDFRKKSSDVQLAAASIGFPKLSRTLDPLPSTVEVCPVVWKGLIDGAEMGQVNVQALNIRNSTDLLDVSMPPSLSVVGRIQPERVWDYVNQIRWAATHDVVILKFIPACDSDQKNYASFLSQLQQRDRFAVLGRVSKHIRDFYLISLPEGSAIPSALASLTSATKLLDKNRNSSLLVGIVVRSRMNGKTGVDGAVVPSDTTDASIEIVNAEPPSSSVRNSTAIPESNPSSLINIPNSKFFSALDVDMRITPPHAVMADVLKNLDIGGLQKILKTVQTKEENTCLRKRKFGDVDTDAEIIPTKLVKVAIDSSAETVPSKVTALPIKSLPPSSMSSISANPIYICTSWPNSSTSDRIAKNIQTGPQSADLVLYSPGLPMEPVIHIPAIDEDLLKIQNDLMEELNSALPAWLAVDKTKKQNKP